MIQITIPDNNINERKYILDIIFNEFLGLEYKLAAGSKKLESYEIELGNGNKLIFEDHFFNKFPNDLEYLKFENIPRTISYQQKTSNSFIPENDIPVLYGHSKSNIKNSTLISCSIDIFASIFFMLSRWEEYVNKNRDSHERFPSTLSLAFKNNFLDRPVVNEYVEMLKNMLKYLDNNSKFKIQNSKLFLTHDVDELYMWKSWKQVFKVGVGDIIKRKSISLALERVAEYFLIRRKKINDPFDTFDWLMDKSEGINVKSRFYFMSGGVTDYDNKYKIDETKSLELIEKIKERGHIIGIHPSYNAFNDTIQFKKELDLLEQTVGQKIVEGREHYLRFEVPTTWQIWEDNGMQVDSTCGYADKEGFRCGTADEFSVFNILTRKKLKLKERPLIFMDGRDFNCNGYTDSSQFKHNLFKYLERNKKYRSNLTILFHNTTFNRNPKYTDEYLRIINVRN